MAAILDRGLISSRVYAGVCKGWNWQNYWFANIFCGTADRSGDGDGKKLEGAFGFEVVGDAVA
jgi:hypothetical protein